jgi:hypothetical protein
VFGRLISLDAYRKRKAPATSAQVALARFEPNRPSFSENFLQDHRLAFLASSEHHGARALCLLLNGRTVAAGSHHFSAILFRYYAESDAIGRFCFIHEHLQADKTAEHTVHRQTLTAFRAVCEAFYRECSKEVSGPNSGCFSITDDVASVLEYFHELGYERRYNTMLETYDAGLRLNEPQRSRQSIRQSQAMMN